MKILGIDPGLNCTGWAIIQQTKQEMMHIDSGKITTNSRQTLSDRLYLLHTGLLQAINSHQKIDAAAIEKTFVNSNAQTSLLLGHARGALLLTCTMLNIKDIHQYSANYIKKTVTGNGHAEKHQMIYALKYLIKNINVDTLTHDIADAIAIAFCHCHAI